MSIRALAIDWKLSLELANNKPELAKSILAMYVEKLPTARAKIIANRNNHQNLHDYIHKLLGASCYCGVPKIKATATVIESTLKTKQTEKIESLLDELIDNIDEVIESYEKQDYY